MKLTKEEKEILDAFEKGTLKRAKNAKKHIKEAEAAARNYFSKDARISIRLSSADLQAIKRKAHMEGLPYQTLIASIIHKYAAGSLKG
jgi:predicted DNA binding CopG/RHH family protein